MTSPTSYAKLQPFLAGSGSQVATAPSLEMTEFGNAERLVVQHGENLRYAHGLDLWYCWDGKRFAQDKTAQADRWAKETVRSIYAEVASITDDEASKRLAQWAKKSQTHAHIRAVLNLASSDSTVAVVPEKFDADPFRFNVENGTIDLNTGDLRPHAREDNVTKLASVTFDPTATCPTWDAFLLRIMDGDAAMVAYIQRAVGYTLTGDVSEQCLFMLHGSGANGKSTFLNTIRAVLGDYGTQADMEAILAKREGGGATPELVALRGARLVAASETNAQTRFNEARLKQLTGGDPITCRELYGSTFEYQPTFKWWLAFNHKPVLSEGDAIWRRIHYIPFDVQIPENERDSELGEKLKAEAAGILAWAVNGCKDWLANGLQPPEKVVAATREYRAESDAIGRFLEESCTVNPKSSTPMGTLYAAYKTWAEREGEVAVSVRRFSTSVCERPGITKGRNSRLRLAQGVALTDAPENYRVDDFAVNAYSAPDSISIVIRAVRASTGPDGYAYIADVCMHAEREGVPTARVTTILDELARRGQVEVVAGESVRITGASA